MKKRTVLSKKLKTNKNYFPLNPHFEKRNNNFVIGTYMKNTMISNWSLIIKKKQSKNKHRTEVSKTSDCYDKFVIKIVFQI